MDGALRSIDPPSTWKKSNKFKYIRPIVAHRYAIFLLKYSIGWRPKKDSIEKRPDWEKTRLRKDKIEKRPDWEKTRLRKDKIEKRPDWEKTRLRKDPIEKPGDWVTQGLRPYRRTDQEEFSFSQDRQTKLIKQWIIKVWAVKMVRSSDSEQWIIKEWAVCQKIWSVVPSKKVIYSRANSFIF